MAANILADHMVQLLQDEFDRNKASRATLEQCLLRDHMPVLYSVLCISHTYLHVAISHSQGLFDDFLHAAGMSDATEIAEA